MTDIQRSKQVLGSAPYATHVAARLIDFFSDTAPWPRRLWDISSVLALREAVEAGGWVEERVLSSGALSWYLQALERQLGPDHGLGDSLLRKELVKLLRSGISAHSRERRRLEQMVPLVTVDYLARWGSQLDGTSSPSPERLGRAIATHLLDCGHSSGHLRRWVNDLLRAKDATVTDLIDAAQRLADQTDERFEVLIPFRSVPDAQALAEPLPEWRSPAATSAWLRAHDPDRPLPRHNGAFSYEIECKDPAAAVRVASAKIDRIQSRRSYARGAHRRPLEPIGQAWVAGQPSPFSLERPGRGAIVLSLESEATMYLADANERLDEALELAAPVNDGPASSAVTGAWAAIESLLNHPGDSSDREEGKVVAADRLAAIVACSWPRAELTALSYRHSPKHPDSIDERLAACQSNLERSTVVADALTAGLPMVLSRATDRAALVRMTGLLTSPRKELGDVESIFVGVFRRLYRQRNIVVHGGSTTTAALEGALRTAAPLLGAGLDRLVHAQLTTEVAPLDLAARAQNSLVLVGDSCGPDVSELLEPA